jgi:hypothetical protein
MTVKTLVISTQPFTILASPGQEFHLRYSISTPKPISFILATKSSTSITWGS